MKENQFLDFLQNVNFFFWDFCQMWPPTFGVGVGKEAVPWHFAAVRQRQEIVPGLDVDDAVEILLAGRAQDP